MTVECIMGGGSFDSQVRHLTSPPRFGKRRSKVIPVAMGAFIPRDVQEFLDGYPDLRDDRSQSNNLKFYSNELKCQPDRKLISEIHDE